MRTFRIQFLIFMRKRIQCLELKCPDSQKIKRIDMSHTNVTYLLLLIFRGDKI